MHILEHVENDAKAMRNPCMDLSMEKTLEYPKVTSREERVASFIKKSAIEHMGETRKTD